MHAVEEIAKRLALFLFAKRRRRLYHVVVKHDGDLRQAPPLVQRERDNR